MNNKKNLIGILILGGMIVILVVGVILIIREVKKPKPEISQPTSTLPETPNINTNQPVSQEPETPITNEEPEPEPTGKFGSPFNLVFKATSKTSEEDLRFAGENAKIIQDVAFVVHPNFGLSDDKIQFLKEVNPEIHLSIYHNLRAITATDPLFKERFYEDHENWFLHCEDDPTEKVRDKTYNNYLADISNEEYREFWITRTREALEDKPEVIDVIFLDVASAKLQLIQFYCKPEKYTNEWWEREIGEFLQEINKVFPDKIVIGNSLKPVYSESQERLTGDYIGLQYANYIDGLAAETWVHYWGKYRGEVFWKDMLNTYITTLKQGTWIGVVQHPEKFGKDDQRRMFGFASYLLISTEDLGFTEQWGEGPGEYILKDEVYYIPLGQPKEELKDKVDDYLSNNIYLREYQNGLVLVNPSETETQTYTLPQEMNLVVLKGSTIDYQTTKEVSLPPISGAILILKK